jgi:hypothetical protein
MGQFLETWHRPHVDQQDAGATGEHPGQGLVEYATLISFIAITMIVALGSSVPN